MNIFSKYVKGGKVLDFGTGNGFTALLLAEAGYKVKAIDIDNYMHEKDTHKTWSLDQKDLWSIFKNKYSNLQFKHYSKRIPYDDNSFDGLFTYAVIEHIPDKEISNVMEEIRRVLKPGGYFFISRLPRKLSYIEHLAKLLKIDCHDRLYGDKEINDLFEKFNFKIIEKSFISMFPEFGLPIINSFYLFFKNLEKILLKTPFKYFSHDIRIIGRKNGNKL